jgi:beta-glucanase (GH16 family)
MAMVAALAVVAGALAVLQPASADDEPVDPGQPPAQVTGGAPWTPVFTDEFSGTTVDGERWNVPDESNYGTGGHQDQCYLAANTTVADGTLRLTAARETVTGCGSNPDGGDSYYFTSGMVTTRQMGGPATFRFRHGYAEVRMRTPRGNLYWPAFWLVGPGDGSTPGWPDYGEFDVSEIYGSNPDISESNYHRALGNIGARSHNVITKGWSSSLNVNPPNPLVAGGTNDWHTYGFNWTEDRLEWFIDGVLVRTYNASTPEDLASFGYDHSIILNLQVGGSGPAYEGYTGREIEQGGYDDGNLSADLPGTMEVDYVRVWQRPPPPPPDPPVVTITTPSSGDTVTATSAPLAGTCETNAGDVTIALTGASTSTATTPCLDGAWATYGALVSGAYSMTASQTAEVTGTSAPVDFTVALPPPGDGVTLDSPAFGALLGAGPTTLSGRCAVDGSAVDVTADGAPAPIASAPCGTTGTWSTSTALADGHWSVTATQVDSSGATRTSPVTELDVDGTAPQTGDDSASVAGAWQRGPVTVTLSPTDAGSGVAQTRYTVDGSTPDATSPTGTTVTLASEGVFTIRYASVDRAGNVEATQTATTLGRIDRTAPVTTDDAASIGTAWSRLDRTVRLTPTDGSAGVAATYATVDGSTPTTASPNGTTVALTTSGAYTVRYFSVDAAGNVEPVKSSGTTVRIDETAPVVAIASPNGQSYGSSTWGSGCSSSNRICGTASDAHSGVANVRVSVQRSNDSRWWSGGTWVTSSTSVAASGTGIWSTPLSTSQLTNKVMYTVSAWATDAAGNVSPTTTRRFTYDTSGPSTTGSGLAVRDRNGAVASGDSLGVTFNEPLDPASVPATATLSLSRSRSNTSYKITGLTNGTPTTGAAGYLTSASSTRTVSFPGTLALSADGRTVTFTVTGRCSGSCSALATTPRAGAFQLAAASTLKDLAGNAASTSSVTAPSQVMF